jgi:hypothetical protein
MHFAFIPYGKKSEVELLISDMEAQKHILKMWKDVEVKNIWIQGQVRVLPFGIYEYVFPREDLDIVLNTFSANENRYQIPKIALVPIKKFLSLKKIPEFKKDKVMLWVREHVNIVPLGIREDFNIIDNLETYRGWEHEAI